MPQASLLKRLDALLGPAACRLWSKPQRGAVHAALANTPGRILVIRPGGIGDMVMLLPMLEALRSRLPDRPIDIVCEARNAPVLRIAGFQGDLLRYAEAPRHTLRELQARPYAAAIDTEQFHHFSAVFAGLSTAPLRVGFRINPQRNGIYTHLVSYDLDGVESEQFLRLLRALLPDVVAPPLEGLLDPRASSRVSLPTGLSLPDQPFLALHVGASIRHKRWPTERFGAVCRRLFAEYGWCTVLLGSATDAPEARSVSACAPEACRDWSGQLTLPQVARVCSAARLLLGPDSGLAHLAVALGTPTTTLFGPSDPRKWRLPAAQHRVVRHALPCSPCSIFGYVKPCASVDCLMSIQPDEVVSAIRDALALG